MAFSVAVVYSGLPDPTSSAGFMTKRAYNGKGRENESQKVCKLMKGWGIKRVQKYESILSQIASYTVTYLPLAHIKKWLVNYSKVCIVYPKHFFTVSILLSLPKNYRITDSAL